MTGKWFVGVLGCWRAIVMVEIVDDGDDLIGKTLR